MNPTLVNVPDEPPLPGKKMGLGHRSGILRPKGWWSHSTTPLVVEIFGFPFFFTFRVLFPVKLLYLFPYFSPILLRFLKCLCLFTLFKFFTSGVWNERENSIPVSNNLIYTLYSSRLTRLSSTFDMRVETTVFLVFSKIQNLIMYKTLNLRFNIWFT